MPTEFRTEVDIDFESEWEDSDGLGDGNDSDDSSYISSEILTLSDSDEETAADEPNELDGDIRTSDANIIIINNLYGTLGNSSCQCELEDEMPTEFRTEVDIDFESEWEDSDGLGDGNDSDNSSDISSEIIPLSDSDEETAADEPNEFDGATSTGDASGLDEANLLDEATRMIEASEKDEEAKNARSVDPGNTEGWSVLAIPSTSADVGGSFTQGVWENGPPLETVDVAIPGSSISDRPPSPDATCTICLGSFHDKSFTDSCLHEFCFSCIKEWSTIKAECPLCKQEFKTIIHDILSPSDFKEYYVDNNSPLIGVALNMAMGTGSFPYSHSLPVTSRDRAMVGRRVYNQFLGGQEPGVQTLRFVRQPWEHGYGDVVKCFGPNYYVRRNVYRLNRWTRPLITSGARESSPLFYRLNPSQTWRLIPWLFRELFILISDEEGTPDIDPNAVLLTILDLINVHPILSSVFRTAILPAIRKHTDQFIHELYQFAVSPHDVSAYDTATLYDLPPNKPNVRLIPYFARVNLGQERPFHERPIEFNNEFSGLSFPGGLIRMTMAGPSRLMSFNSMTIAHVSSSEHLEREEARPPLKTSSSDSESEGGAVSGVGVESVRSLRLARAARRRSASRRRSGPVLPVGASKRKGGWGRKRRFPSRRSPSPSSSGWETDSPLVGQRQKTPKFSPRGDDGSPPPSTSASSNPSQA